MNARLIRLCLVFAVSLASVAMPVRHCSLVSGDSDQANSIQSAVGVAGLLFARLGETDDDTSRGSRDRFRPTVDLTAISVNFSNCGTHAANSGEVSFNTDWANDRPLQCKLCRYLI